MRIMPRARGSISTRRDVLFLNWDDKSVLVVGCDSAGAIGPKRYDIVRADAYSVGKFTARVALAEVLSTGAAPFCLIGTMPVEPNPAGREMMRGIKDELKRARLSSAVSILQSTENNFRVNQTGLGVTVIGRARPRNLRIRRSRSGDLLVALGKPSVGSKVLVEERRSQLPDLTDVLYLLGLRFVHELIPVGSRGIRWEAQGLALDSNLRLKLNPRCRLDLHQSAGPATVILCSLSPTSFRKLSELTKKPVTVIGQLCRRGIFPQRTI